ncbi:hypothetical protein RJ55_08507 [Drechmeria coniospora]|nr:hypothetical protein RJ55_08507 [Drechmeria coniospora]
MVRHEAHAKSRDLLIFFSKSSSLLLLPPTHTLFESESGRYISHFSSSLGRACADYYTIVLRLQADGLIDDACMCSWRLLCLLLECLI